jgi:hypothetical protein
VWRRSFRSSSEASDGEQLICFQEICGISDLAQASISQFVRMNLLTSCLCELSLSLCMFVFLFEDVAKSLLLCAIWTLPWTSHHLTASKAEFRSVGVSW